MAAVAAAGDDGFPETGSDWPVLDGTDLHSGSSRTPSAVRSVRRELYTALLLLEWVAFLLEREHQKVRLLSKGADRRKFVEVHRPAAEHTGRSTLHQVHHAEGTLRVGEEDKVPLRRQGTGRLYAIRRLVRTRWYEVCPERTIALLGTSIIGTSTDLSRTSSLRTSA